MTGILLALTVAAAGGVGAATRCALDLALPARDRLPWALLVINGTGSFALGLALGLLSDHKTWLLIVGTGFLGGYTTFSAASLDAAQRWVDGQRLRGLASAALMVVVCVAAASLGVAGGSVAWSP